MAVQTQEGLTHVCALCSCCVTPVTPLLNLTPGPSLTQIYVRSGYLHGTGSIWAFCPKRSAFLEPFPTEFRHVFDSVGIPEVAGSVCATFYGHSSKSGRDRQEDVHTETDRTSTRLRQGPDATRSRADAFRSLSSPRVFFEIFLCAQMQKWKDKNPDKVPYTFTTSSGLVKVCELSELYSRGREQCVYLKQWHERGRMVVKQRIWDK